MPVDNHKTYRFMVLDQCLRNRHRIYTIDDLLEKCNKALAQKGYKAVSKRTIQGDLEQMALSPYNARFEDAMDGHKKIKRYASSFSGIELFNMSDDEKERLDAAIRVLGRFEGNPQYDWVRFCLQQIVSDEFMDDERSIISFQNNPDLYGIEHFETLLKAIASKQPLKVLYAPYPIKKDGNVIVRNKDTYNLHPYHLKQFNNRWFLIAQVEGKDYIGNYALDRIESIEPLHKKFIETDVDFEEYFDDAIGVSVKGEPVQVLLRVDKVRYPYIKTKPFHWSQTELKEFETPTHVVVRLKVCLNNELEAAVLSYGNDVEVIEPESLRDKIADRVGEMIEIYKQ